MVAGLRFTLYIRPARENEYVECVVSVVWCDSD